MIEKILPGSLKIGQKFRCRQTKNSRKYVVTGLVLKICRENGFKAGSYPSWEEGQVKVPVNNHHAGELILKPDVEIYLL